MCLLLLNCVCYRRRQRATTSRKVLCERTLLPIYQHRQYQRRSQSFTFFPALSCVHFFEVVCCCYVCELFHNFLCFSSLRPSFSQRVTLWLQRFRTEQKSCFTSCKKENNRKAIREGLLVKFCFSFRLIIQDLNKQYLTYINELTKGSFFLFIYAPFSQYSINGQYAYTHTYSY